MFDSNGGTIDLFVYGKDARRAVTEYATSLDVSRKDIKTSQWKKNGLQEDWE